MPDRLHPGDLRRLSEPALAAAGEFTALAALTRSSHNPDAAVTALASASQDEVAFTWLWALVREQESRWRSVKLPEQVSVPESLHHEVTEFIVKAPAGQRQISIAEDGAARLLHALGQTPLGLSVARTSFSEPEAPSPRVRDAAITLLAASTDHDGRALVVERLARVPEHKRAAAFERLHPPYNEAELAAILSALQFVTDRPIEDADFAAIATVVARLPEDALAELLGRTWRRPDNKQKLSQAGLVPKIGTDRLQVVLAHELGEDTTKLLLAGAASLPAEQQLALGTYTFAAFPSDWSQPIWNSLVGTIQMARQHRFQRREPALAALWTLTTAASDEHAAQALAELLDHGELLSAAHDHRAEPRTSQRFGAVAAALLQKSTDTWAEEVAEVADVLGTDYLVGVAAGLPAEYTLPGALRTVVMDSAQAQAGFAKAGFGAQLAAWAETPTSAETLLKAAHTDLLDLEVCDLLGRADWAAIGPDAYLTLCRSFDGRLPVLVQQLRQAVESLTGPEAAAAGPDVLTTLLTLALDAGLRHDLGDQAETTAAVTRLLDHPDRSVIDAACAWIRVLDLTPETHACDHHRVKAVVAADNDRGGTLPTLVTLRAELARRLNELALDTTLEIPDRITHLELAAEVDPGTARDTALSLAATHNNDLRAASATVVAATPGRPDDLKRILELLTSESRQDIRHSLEAAKHRISSGTIGEAVNALADLLEPPPDPARLDPQILVPDPLHHDRFVLWVDKARARADNHDDPGSFIEAVINLSDLMVDIVLVAATDAGAKTGLTAQVVQAIRDNGTSGKRPDIGDLLVRQNLQPLFGWFPLCTALRKKRTAHPSPLGSTKPHNLGSNDLITAKTLFRDITNGWMDDMHRYR